MNNPYEYLGVSRNATEKDIMDAYRRIAGEINSSSLSDEERTRKMDELNNAYDIVLNDLRGTSSYVNYDSNHNYNNYNNNNSSSQYSDVRQRLSNGRVDDAETILDGIPTNMRNAEWYYLKGIVHQRRGWLNEAYSCYQMAYSLEPTNREYAAAFNSMNSNVNGGYRTTRRQNNSNDCDSCDICTGLICIDCCCECCGEDFISCC